MMDVKLQKETAIQNEQQSNFKQKIIDDIIKILADNNLSIYEARELLNLTSKKLGRQIVRELS